MKTTEYGMYLEPLFNYACEHDGEFDRLAVHLILAKQTGVVEKILDDIQGDLGYQIITKRCLWAGFEIEPALAALLSATAKSPGCLVMLAHAIYHFPNRVPDQAVTLGEFGENFPNGLPSDETLSQAWDAQKIPNGYGQFSYQNGIDLLPLFCATETEPYNIPRD